MTATIAAPPAPPSATPAAGPPLDLTTFVGRAAELAELERLLGPTRLLTLTGAGGSGKTRLARELVARRVDGAVVAWAELAPLDDARLIARQVAAAFGVSEVVSGPERLVDLLRTRSGLLVLDNCEHLVDGCAEVAQALLLGCPELRILATSREPLGVKGERAWLVPPLSLPPVGAAATAGDSEAVRLFVERARDVVPDFALTAANAPAITEICRRLDGIPLAIELAAARVRVLPPEQMRERLDDTFRVLTGGGRTAIPRHRTLRATIDWSHALLSEPQRVLLRRQSIFRGGFTLEAAEAVCAGDGLAEWEVLDLVAGLVDRSLLAVREHGGAARYTPLETVRQYGLERLAESGEADGVRARHARFVAGLVEAAAPHATTPRRRAAFDALMPDVDNIREALHWTADHDPRSNIRLVGKLGWFWFATRHWTEATRWYDRALALPESAEPGPDRAALLFAAGAIASLQGQTDRARPLLEESAALAVAAGDAALEAYSLNYLGMTYAQEARTEGLEPLTRAAAWFRSTGDDYGLRLSLLLLAVTAQVAGRQEDALRLNEEAVEVARRFGQDRELTVSLNNLAIIHLMQGRLDRAEPLLMEALAASRRDPSYFFIANSLDTLGEVWLREGRLEAAGRVLGAAEVIREMVGAQQFRINRMRLEPLLAEARRGADAVALQRGWTAGRGLTAEQAVDEALGQATGEAADPWTPQEATESTSRAIAAAPPIGEAGVTAGPGVSGPAEQGAVDLEVRALGPLEVYLGGRLLGPDAWPYAKPRELLVLLMVHPGGRTREQVGQALWPGASAAQVKNSFHVTLHHLRKTLGGTDRVVLDGDRYRLSTDRSQALDADRFEQLARALLAAESKGEGSVGAERVRAALSLYRGDFLEGEVAGPWHEEPRDRLRRLRVALDLLLARQLETAGDHAAAAAAYHGVAIREELNEEAHRGVMRAWSRSGERVRALRHYERLVELLSDELDAAPEPETVALYETLRGAG